ncbi:MAG: Hin recombinase [Muribaculaceae bacterium]|nr:Hin recombinase [Muribaculaceae bacterium]
MSNKKQQNSTELTPLEQVTGLTPQQEQAALLLASGESITDVASRINVNRATIYLWQQKISFQCFYNQQCQIIQDNIRNGLCGLYAEALNSVHDCLKSKNEAVKLRAAMYVIGKVEMIDASQQDPEAEIRKLCTHMEDASFDMFKPYEVFDKDKYQDLMKENGLM